MPQLLVVDDSQMELEIICGLLDEVTDQPILREKNGQKAIDLMRERQVDLVITDLRMPEVDGLELIKMAQREFAETPIILLTEHGSEEVAVEALQAGAASYIPKRLRNPLLKETVSHLLRTIEEELAEKKLMMNMTHNRCEFVLENDLDTIIALVRYFREGMRGLQLCNRMDRIRVCTALEEALLNAFYHGNLELSSELKETGRFQEVAAERCVEQPYSDRRIHVRAELDEVSVRFEIRDQGPGFDVASIPDPRDASRSFKLSGRGLLLMRSFMDEVSFNPAGNEVTLYRKHDAG